MPLGLMGAESSGAHGLSICGVIATCWPSLRPDPCTHGDGILWQQRRECRKPEVCTTLVGAYLVASETVRGRGFLFKPTQRRQFTSFHFSVTASALLRSGTRQRDTRLTECCPSRALPHSVLPQMRCAQEISLRRPLMHVCISRRRSGPPMRHVSADGTASSITCSDDSGCASSQRAYACFK